MVDLAQELELPSLECAVPLKEIYAQTDQLEGDDDDMSEALPR